jgi:hypothetical protein
MFGRLIQRQVHVTFASAAVFLLKVLLPYFFDTSGLLAQVRDTAITLGHVSGPFPREDPSAYAPAF